MAVPATAAAQAAEQGSGGLPQFDLGQWPGEMLWMAIIFAVLLFLFARVFAPRVGGTMAAREDKIGGDIGQARRLRDEAEAQSKAAAQDLAEARARAQRLGADAKAAAASEAARRQAEEEARLAEVMAAAEARIAAARAEAMTHVRGIAAETAEAIVARLTGLAADAGEVERALEGVG
jgi:F-type H+-transporting ATPase subunit b